MPTPNPNACTVKLHDESPFQPELLVVASINDLSRPDALIDSGCQVTAISSEFARQLQLPLKPSNITIGVADSRRIKVAGTARATIRVLNARPVEMSVLVFDGLLYSVLIGLDYLAATSAMIQPGQSPFLSFPIGGAVEAIILPLSRISTSLELNAAVFKPLVGPGHIIYQSANLPEQDPPEVNLLLPAEFRLEDNPPAPKIPIKSTTEMTVDEYLPKIMSCVKTSITSEREALQLLLSEFKEAFATTLADISVPADVPEFFINTLSDDPALVGSRYRKRHTDEDRTTIEAQTKIWLENNIIEPCLHPNPIINNLMTVPKSDGTRRVCIDATALNRATPFDATLTPDMREILERMVGAEFISVFDLFSGYLQIPFRVEDRHKLAFTTRFGVYQPTRMFFGSKTACAFFCLRILRVEIDAELSAFLAAYFDDLTIHSLTFDDHLIHLRKFLTAMVKYRLKINLPKSIIAAKEAKALGVMVSSKGIYPVPEDIDAIIRMPHPTTRTEVKAFLGTTGFYRQFIPDFATISAPLAALSAGVDRFTWSEHHNLAFELLRVSLSTKPVLALPILSQPFQIYTDASSVGIGGVVTQIQPDGLEKPVAFFSRQLIKAEKNYSVTEQELLAIVFMLAKTRHWIAGKSTTVVTDHEALQFLLSSPDLKSRLIRWKLAINQFIVTIIYRKGDLNIEGADMLSRLPCPPFFPALEVPKAVVAMAAILSCTLPPLPNSPAKFQHADMSSQLPYPSVPPSLKSPSPVVAMATIVSDIPPSVLSSPREAHTLVTLLGPGPEPKPSVAFAPADLQQEILQTVDTRDQELFSPHPLREVRALAFQLDINRRPRTSPVDPFRFRDPFRNPDLLALIKSDTIPSSSATLIRKLKVIAANYKWDSEMLFSKRSPDNEWLWVPLLAQRTTFVARSHLLGHFGQISTVLRLLRGFKVWWPSISEDVAAYISTCAACVTRLPSPAVHHPAIALPIPGIFHRVAMDLTLGLPLTERGNIGILCIMEYLTKFPVLYAIKSKTAEETAGHLLNFFAMYGPSHEILSDQGGEFVNSVVKALCNNLGVEKRVTSSYSPSTNGMIERFNRTLLRSLETHAANHPTDWDLSLDYVALAYRTNVHAATGTTPFELMFGRPANSFSTPRPVLTADSCISESLLGRAEEIKHLVESTLPDKVKVLEDYQTRQMATQNKAAPVRLLPLEEGAVVYRRNNQHQKKMDCRFLGPFRVKEVTLNGLYKLVNRHGSLLKKAYPLDQLKIIDPRYAEAIWKAELTQEFVVTALIDHRASPHGIEYLVQWEGFDSDHNSWIRATDILDEDLITTYEARTPATSAVAK